MNIKEIKGTSLKRLMNAEKSSFRWHNKNKNGGNFGIEIRGIEGNDYQICADYGSDGNFSLIRFGYVHQAGMRIALGRIETLEELCIRLLKIIELQKKIDSRFHEIKEEVSA